MTGPAGPAEPEVGREAVTNRRRRRWATAGAAVVSLVCGLVAVLELGTGQTRICGGGPTSYPKTIQRDHKTLVAIPNIGWRGVVVNATDTRLAGRTDRKRSIAGRRSAL